MAAIAPVTLRTDRLVLRPYDESDAPAVFAACQDPEIQRWTRVPSPYLWEHATEYLATRSPDGWRNGTAATFAVCESGSGRLIASVGLHFDRAQEEGTAEIGYWCVAAARGAGYATEAVAEVARWGFAECGVQRLEWHAAVGNTASRRVAEKVGFTVEGTLRSALVLQGRRVDEWVASLLPGELRPQSALPRPTRIVT